MNKSENTDPDSFLPAWKDLRARDLASIEAKLKSGIELSEVEKMILHPYSSEQAHKQVEELNKKFLHRK